MVHSCYIHVPFCKAFCTYCDFYHLRHDQKLESEYIEALRTEIALKVEGGRRPELDTLYFGGGTPTVLSERSWETIFGCIRGRFTILPDCEITVEANPESVSREKLEHLRGLGVNRVSIGAQSFRNSDLRILGRIHDSTRIGMAAEATRNAGIENFSLDLIYSLPGESADSLLSGLKSAVALGPDHFSLYALTLENGVPLQLQVERGQVCLPDDDEAAYRFLQAVEFLDRNGYRQYEISNFAKPGLECRHNLNYWQQGDYFGFGPSAVSTLDGIRYRNLPDLSGYLEDLRQGKAPPQEIEKLDERSQLIERIMLSLRLTEGLNIKSLRDDYGYDVRAVSGEILRQLECNGDMVIQKDRISLTPQGMLRFNSVVEVLLP